MHETEVQFRDRSIGPPRPLPELPEVPEQGVSRGDGTVIVLSASSATRTVGAPRSVAARWIRQQQQQAQPPG